MLTDTPRRVRARWLRKPHLSPRYGPLPDPPRSVQCRSLRFLTPLAACCACACVCALDLVRVTVRPALAAVPTAGQGDRRALQRVGMVRISHITHYTLHTMPYLTHYTLHITQHAIPHTYTLHITHHTTPHTLHTIPSRPLFKLAPQIVI